MCCGVLCSGALKCEAVRYVLLFSFEACFPLYCIVFSCHALSCMALPFVVRVALPCVTMRRVMLYCRVLFSCMFVYVCVVCCCCVLYGVAFCCHCVMLR